MCEDTIVHYVNSCTVSLVTLNEHESIVIAPPQLIPYEIKLLVKRVT